MKPFRALILMLCAVLLVVASVVGTLAYLQDSKSVVNTFTVGNVHLKLDEAVLDDNGNPTAERSDQGNSYRLVPGKTYTKDPTVTVLKGSEESYVRMLVTINCYDELVAIFGDPFLPQNFVSGWVDTVWLTTRVIDVDDEANTATYEFRYHTTVKAGANADEPLDPLFTTMTVPSTLTGDQLATIADLKIVVEAHAIQAVGFNSADDAWGAFSK